jgi:antitoxin CcdA
MLVFDNAPKRPTNLTLNAKVLDTAKDLGMNISATVDELLRQAVIKAYTERWNEDNQGAIADYNARIEREGTFSQRIQRFVAEQPKGSDGPL